MLQLIDGKNTSLSADYAGMHIAIVLQHCGTRKFHAVDSNSQCDRIMRQRDYEPSVVAACYANISVHAYHLDRHAGTRERDRQRCGLREHSSAKEVRTATHFEPRWPSSSWRRGSGKSRSTVGLTLVIEMAELERVRFRTLEI